MKIFYKENLISLFIFLFLLNIPSTLTRELDIYNQKSKEAVHFKSKMNLNYLISNLIWTKIETKEDINIKELKWENINEEDALKYYPVKLNQTKSKNILKPIEIGSLTRSIVFDNDKVGPDISWIIPPGFRWNKKYKFDLNARGHNTIIPEPSEKKFFGWNNGDAVGLISYQFLHSDKSSFGINIGVRSLYEGNEYGGGSTSIGEGLSSGFRWDYALTETSGIAFGAEQLIHFDDTTDTGRNIYLTTSKAWWHSSNQGIDIFPLYVATAGVGTGRMGVGTVRVLCNDILGGSGTETSHKRDLCWSPVFSLASVWNEKFSTFFEYNSRFFLLGSSFAPIQSIPARGTFALILSDHVDNYKLHNTEEINWVFNISLGF